MNLSKSSPWAIALLLSLFYFLLTPVIYFRHDDWLMLGNAVTILPRDWSFLWKTSWYTSPSHEEIWFFRPLFKLAIWQSFKFFKFEHFFWIMTHWILVLGAVYFSMKSLDRLDWGKSRSSLFAILFLTSLPFHFGNIVWVGEGMMNSPQLFLLSLSIFLFTKLTAIGQALSLITYLCALGFKESSAFLPLFLLAWILANNQLAQQWKRLIPHFVCMLIYLTFRLGFLPFNPGYKPHFTFQTLVKPSLYFAFFLSTPIVIVFLSASSHSFSTWKPILKKFFPFSFFLALLVAPHIGHPFFSPGWLLLPGFFTLLSFSVSVEESLLKQLNLKNLAIITFFISLLPVAWQINNLGWLKWSISQRQVHTFIKDLSEKDVREVFIETCADPDHPQATFERVVGATENLQHLWNLHHSTQVEFTLVPCGTEVPSRQNQTGRVFARWHFPNFEVN